MQDERPRSTTTPSVFSPLIAGVVLAILVTVVYGNSFSEEFVFDSATIIQDDPRIRELNGDNLSAILTENYWWPNMPSGLYRPLTTLSYLINRAVLGAGDDPRGYQVINLALHWLVAFLTFVLGVRLGLSAGWALGAAAMFAIHPVATESVVNIVGRADQLAACAVLGGVIVAWDARRAGWTPRTVIGFAALSWGGILCKENAIALAPISVALGLVALPSGDLSAADCRRAGRTWWSVIVLLGFIAVLAFAAIRWWFTMMNPGGDHPFVDNPLTAAAWWPARLTALRVLADGLSALVAPYWMSADYSYAQIPVATGGWANSSDRLGWIALIVGLGACGWLARSWLCGGSRAAFVWSASLLALLPTSNLFVMIGSIRADRFWYLPFAFVAVGTAWGLSRFASMLSRDPRYELARRGGMGLLVAWMLALAVVAHVRTYDWRNSLTLWDATVAAVPGSYKAHMNVGVLLKNLPEPDRRQLERAVDELRTACEILEQPPLAPHQQVGRMYSGLGEACARLAELKREGGETEEAGALDVEAEEAFRRGVDITRALQSEFMESLRARGVPEDRLPVPYGDQTTRAYAAYLVRRDRAAEGLVWLESLLKVKPTDAPVRVEAAIAAEKAGKSDAAVTHALWAIILGTQRSEAIAVAGRVLAKMAPPDDSVPVVVGQGGRPTLNLDNPIVAQHVRSEFSSVRAHFVRIRDTISAGRVTRIARHDFGLDLADQTATRASSQ